jgi:PiT family inorganic phosphate transporter
MTTLTALVVCVIAMALLFDFVNGWNDSANAIATVVGTRVLSPFSAVILAAILNLAGAMVGTEVANTMAKMIHVNPVTLAEQEGVMILIIAGLLSAAIWAGLMTVAGLPISGSHSLIGGIIGAAVAAGGVDMLVGSNIAKTILAMLVAPVMGFIAAYFFYVLLIRATVRLHPSIMNRVFGRLQILSASWMAFTHGTNDAQKVMGIITMALLAGGFQEPEPGDKFHVKLSVKVGCALAISLGTAMGGWKVIKTLGHHLTKLGPPEGFAAETSASVVLSAAAALGVPTSTTHTITGAILGVGATRGMSSVRWGLGEKILLAWVFTLPSTAALGGALFWMMALLTGSEVSLHPPQPN